jgi:hypothetical protein
VFLCWIELAHRILKGLKPDAKMAIAGWSIDSMFTGARDVLPKDIAFASLSGYEPQWALRANVIDRFWKGVAGRERHYVSWCEFDGRCLGLLQPKVRSFDHLLTDTHAAGIDAAVFLHWRTRILDGNARYTSLRCWRNDLRPEEFYRDYARAKFGEQAGPLCVEALLALEDYDQWQLADRGTYLSNAAYDYGVLPDPIYRLTQALGIPFGSQGREPEGDVRQTIQALTSPREKPVSRTDEEVFQPGESGHGLAEAIQRLRRIRESLRPAERVARGARAQANLRYFTGRIEYYQQYLAFYGSILEVYLTLTRDPVQPLKDRLQRAASILKSVDVNRLVAKYAEHIGNPGERGVLVSLNRKLIEPVQAITARVELLQKT